MRVKKDTIRSVFSRLFSRAKSRQKAGMLALLAEEWDGMTWPSFAIQNVDLEGSEYFKLFNIEGVRSEVMLYSCVLMYF